MLGADPRCKIRIVLSCNNYSISLDSLLSFVFPSNPQLFGAASELVNFRPCDEEPSSTLGNEVAYVIILYFIFEKGNVARCQ